MGLGGTCLEVVRMLKGVAADCECFSGHCYLFWDKNVEK